MSWTVGHEGLLNRRSAFRIPQEMSGHSHWATIKHDKSVEDARRGKVFTKVSRLVTIAVKKGGGDPSANPVLRKAIEKAREVRMGNDLIERAIKKALGEGKGGEPLVDAVLEGYGPGGVGFLVEVLTDNKNRTVAEIRNVFTRHGGNLGEAGSTAYIFTPNPRQPQFLVPLPDKETEKKVLDLAQELQDHDDIQEVYANYQLSE